MKLVIGKGAYTVNRALLINDPKHNFFNTEVVDLSFYMTLKESGAVNSAFIKQSIKDFETSLKKVTKAELEVEEVSMNEDHTFGCPGYLYIQEAIIDLQFVKHKKAIYLELDNEYGYRISVILYPRMIGYDIGIPAEVKGEAIREFLTTEQNILVAMPGISTPNELDIPEYISSKACNFASYRIPKRKGDTNG